MRDSLHINERFYPENINDLLSPSIKIMIKKFTPFWTAARTVTGSIDQDEFAQVGTYTEEIQRFSATLGGMDEQSPPLW
jgi:hypothetical protein